MFSDYHTIMLPGPEIMFAELFISQHKKFVVLRFYCSFCFHPVRCLVNVWNFQYIL